MVAEAKALFLEVIGLFLVWIFALKLVESLHFLKPIYDFGFWIVSKFNLELVPDVRKHLVVIHSRLVKLTADAKATLLWRFFLFLTKSFESVFLFLFFLFFKFLLNSFTIGLFNFLLLSSLLGGLRHFRLTCSFWIFSSFLSLSFFKNNYVIILLADNFSFFSTFSKTNFCSRGATWVYWVFTKRSWGARTRTLWAWTWGTRRTAWGDWFASVFGLIGRWVFLLYLIRTGGWASRRTVAFWSLWRSESRLRLVEVDPCCLVFNKLFEIYFLEL